MGKAFHRKKSSHGGGGRGEEAAAEVRVSEGKAVGGEAGSVGADDGALAKAKRRQQGGLAFEGEVTFGGERGALGA